MLCGKFYFSAFSSESFTTFEFCGRWISFLLFCFRSELNHSDSVRSNLEERYQELLGKMQKLSSEFNSTHHELCSSKQKLADAIETADVSLNSSIRESTELQSELKEVLKRLTRSERDSIKLKGEASKAIDLLHMRCAELEEDKRLLQNQIQV